jgi:arylsulfatase A-like enzyme
MSARPNVLIVCTDQQRTDSLGCYGSTFMRTPGFDHVAERGTRFDRAYCSSAVCTPSRISMLTGQYVARHGVWNVGVNAGQDIDLLSHKLARAGYETGIVGKAHFEAYGATPEQSRESVAGFANGYGDWTGPYYGFTTAHLALGHTTIGLSGHYGGWLHDQLGPEGVARLGTARPVDDTRDFGGNAYDWDLPTRLSNSVWTADNAIAFLERERDADCPFFLFASFQDPHHPHAVPTDYADRVDPATVPLPSFHPAELDLLPPHVRVAHEGRLEGSDFARRWPMSGQHNGFDYRNIPESSQRLGRAYYYSLVQLIDQQLVRLWDCLERNGLADDTLVIVTSDHGELLGDHGLWMKGPFHYEQLVRIPLLAMGPGIPAGSVDSNVASLVDIVPTVLAATGVAPEGAVIDGTALLGIPEDARTVLCETVLDWQGMICRSVIGERYKLTSYANALYGELFDLRSDPQEKHNLWSNGEWASIRAEMLGRLLDHDAQVIASSKERISYA